MLDDLARGISVEFPALPEPGPGAPPPPQDFEAALRGALRGEVTLSPRIAGGDPRLVPPPPRAEGAEERLSSRERAVLKRLAAGLSMKEVAAELGIATRTVAYHKYRMMEALSLRTSAELVGFAVRNGLT